MAKTKMTLEEKINLLNDLRDIEEKIIKFDDELTQSLEWEVATNEEDGFEPEQATNYEGGELLYKEVVTDGSYPRRGTVAELTDKGVTEYEPYFRTKYRKVIRPFKECTEYEQDRIIKIIALKMFFEDIDFEGEFPAYLERAKKEAAKRVPEYLAEKK